MPERYDDEGRDRADQSDSRNESRRSILAKMVGATGFVTGLRFLPTSWTQPLLRAESLPRGLENLLTSHTTTEIPVITTGTPPPITTDVDTTAPFTTTTGPPGTTTTPRPLTTTQIPLPVELVDFNAVASERDVVLTWATLSEFNNAGFAIETTPASGLVGSFGWKEVAFVDGYGTSNRRRDYRYRVKDLEPGRHRFRLRQTDFDGAFEYSSVVEVLVEIPGTHHLSQVHPNPFSTTAEFQLTLEAQQHVTASLYNQLGQKVAALHDGPLGAESRHVFRIEAGDLSNGVYVLRVKGADFVATQLVTLVR